MSDRTLCAHYPMLFKRSIYQKILPQNGWTCLGCVYLSLHFRAMFVGQPTPAPMKQCTTTECSHHIHETAMDLWRNWKDRCWFDSALISEDNLGSDRANVDNHCVSNPRGTNHSVPMRVAFGSLDVSMRCAPPKPFPTRKQRVGKWSNTETNCHVKRIADDKAPNCGRKLCHNHLENKTRNALLHCSHISPDSPHLLVASDVRRPIFIYKLDPNSKIGKNPVFQPAQVRNIGREFLAFDQPCGPLCLS